MGQETEPRNPRWSPELLRLRKVQDILVKQCEYTQAHLRQQKIADMERQEKRKWEKARTKKIKALEATFLQNQRTTFNCAKEKVATARRDMVKKNQRGREQLQ